MSDMKTVETDADVAAFLAAHPHRGRAEDAAEVAAMIGRVSGFPPRLWGDAMIGFGAYDYARADGSRHRWFRAGVSPRKANLVVYVMSGFDGLDAHLARLGPHRRGASCLYLGRLAKVDRGALEEIVAASLAEMARRHP
ncbi:MAG: DUF1801 domain-containing protein [Pseudomonadota bacterium]